ncbi:MAG: EAL domain-containing protein [Campylobacterota bacterium]|nr:EAL domain-containing protein [Campylobacterota bacterium]
MINITFNFSDIRELNKQLSSDIVDTSQTLIQLFSATTDIVEIQSMQAFFKANFPNSHLIGTTTDGIIDGAEVYVGTKSVVSFTIFEKSSIKSSLVEHKSRNYSSYEIGKKLASELVAKETKVIISFADGINTNGEDFVNGVSDIAPGVVLAGGLAADNGMLNKTYIFNQEKICSLGAVGVSISNSELNVATNYTFDWMPIGKEMKVTKSIKNRVYEIDGMSAVAIYSKYMGEELALQLPKVGIEFPLLFKRNGVLVGRAVLLKHDDGSLTFAGNINEGESVRFGVGSIEQILKNSDYHARKTLGKMQYESEAVFVYSCMARRRFMNKYAQDELKMLSAIGDVSGFFTYGEFFHNETKNQLLNETMTLLVMSEDKRELNYAQETTLDVSYRIGVDAQHVVAHLANRVSNELAELNTNLELRIKESSDYIYKQAFYDRLTGLPNRQNLINRLSDSKAKMVILINIDDFTTINDFYGYELGDEVIKRLATILQESAADAKSEVFKLPSDEFAILVDASYVKESIESQIESCIYKISAEDFKVSDEHNVHVSVTVAAALVDGNSAGLVNADMTLKLAKKAGKKYMVFNEDLELAKQYESNIKMANVIKNAISNNGIIPYFQPIINIKTQEVQKYEALVRLREEDSTVLSPYSFLEISQKIKLYPQITEIMIDKTFSYFASKGREFSINLAFSDILDEGTRRYLFAKIEEYDVASELTIELLETQENDQQDVVRNFIDEVYGCGAKIAIDDFGSGYANFEHMTTMKSDFMKIDGSLIKEIDRDKNAKLIVETIIIFAQKLQKKTIAEYVHSKEVYDIVKSLGIDYAQGYYLGEPKPEIV